MKVRCEFCHGTGISDIERYQTGEGAYDGEKLIECKNCNGAGEIEVADTEILRKEYGL